MLAQAVGSQAASPVGLTAVELGDRVRLALPSAGAPAAVRVGPDYRLDAGDTLGVYVTGRSNLRYQANPSAGPNTSPNEVTVALSGEITIPLAGTIKAAGLTVTELKGRVREALSRYIRSPEVSVTLASPRTVRIWVNGAVDNPGPQYTTATTTVAEALLRAGIKAEGSTRLITLERNGSKRTIDLFRVVSVGDLSQNVLLEADDAVFVPPVVDWVEVHGEVVRPGRYEMVSLAGKRSSLSIADLVGLASGTTPSAATEHCVLSRPSPSGDSEAARVDVAKALGSPDAPENRLLRNGDGLTVPSIAAYQPMVRLVGEFRGSGVYQRIVGGGEAEIRNKSGIYRLSKGQTAGDVIRETGGVTPQADLKKARVERAVDGTTQTIALDLERILQHKDSSADVVLQGGDTLVLPSLNDAVSVFGEVVRPGSYSYVPDRRLVDYLADAGGPTNRAKQSSIAIVRGDPAKPTILRADVRKPAKEGSKNNPVLEPGDVVYMPEKIIADWRDIAQIISTIRLIALL